MEEFKDDFSDNADKAREIGNLEESLSLYLKAIEFRRETYGIEHIAVAPILLRYGELLRVLNKFEEARIVLEEALAINVKTYGNTHSSVGETLNNLGQIHRLEGNYNEAEPLLLEALRIRKEIHGGIHPLVGATLNNLGELYRETGDYIKAISFHVAAVDAFMQSVGPDHPGTVNANGNYGVTLRRQARVGMEQGETLLQNAVDYLHNHDYDVNHPWVLKFETEQVYNRAQQLAGAGLHEQSVELFDDLLGKSVVFSPQTSNGGSANPLQLPPLHKQPSMCIPQTDLVMMTEGKLSSLLGQAVALQQKGKYLEAEDILNLCLASPRKTLGESYCKFNEVQLRQAQCKYLTADYSGAESLCVENLQALVDLNGPDHQDNVPALILLANIHRCNALYGESEKLLLQALVIVKTGLKHEPEILVRSSSKLAEMYATILIGLANLYRLSGQYGRVDETLAQASTVCERSLSKDSPIAAEFLSCRAAWELCNGSFCSAEQSYESCLHIRQTVFGPHHPAVASTLTHLAEICYIKGSLNESFALIESSLSMKLEFFHDQHPSIATTKYWKAMICGSFCNHGDASALMNEVLVARTSCHGEDHPTVSDTLVACGLLAVAAGCTSEEVRNSVDRAIENYEGCYEQNENGHLDVIQLKLCQASIAAFEGRFNSALELFEHCIASLEKHLLTCGGAGGDMHYMLVEAKSGAANMCRHLGHFTACKALVRDVGIMSCKLFGSDSLVTAKALLLLGQYYTSLGRYRDAKVVLSRCMVLRCMKFGLDNPATAEVLIAAADNLLMPGYYADAARTCQAGYEMLVNCYGEKSIFCAAALSVRARLLLGEGKGEEAEAAIQESLCLIKDNLGGENNYFYLQGLLILAEVYKNTAKFGMAEATLRHALKIVTAQEQLCSGSSFASSTTGSNKAPKRSITCAQIASLYCDILYGSGKFRDALAILLDELLPLYEVVLGRIHPLSVYIRGRIGLCLHNIKKQSVSGVFEGVLKFFDEYGQLPFASDHSWVQALGGFRDLDSEILAQRVSGQVNVAALTAWALPQDGSSNLEFGTMPKDEVVSTDVMLGDSWGAVYYGPNTVAFQKTYNRFTDIAATAAGVLKDEPLPALLASQEILDRLISKPGDAASDTAFQSLMTRAAISQASEFEKREQQRDRERLQNSSDSNQQQLAQEQAVQDQQKISDDIRQSQEQERARWAAEEKAFEEAEKARLLEEERAIQEAENFRQAEKQRIAAEEELQKLRVAEERRSLIKHENDKLAQERSALEDAMRERQKLADMELAKERERMAEEQRVRARQDQERFEDMQKKLAEAELKRQMAEDMMKAAQDAEAKRVLEAQRGATVGRSSASAGTGTATSLVGLLATASGDTAAAGPGAVSADGTVVAEVAVISPRAKKMLRVLEASVFLYERAQELFNIGMYEKACPLLEECLVVREAHVPGSVLVGDTLFLQAENYRLLSKFKSATEKYESCVAIRTALGGEQGGQNLAVSEALLGLANNYNNQGLYQRAQLQYADAMNIRIALLPDSDPLLGHGLCYQSLNTLKLGRIAEAKAWSDRAYAILQQAFGMRTVDLSNAMISRSEILCVQGKTKEAKPLLEQAISVRRMLLGDMHPLVADCLMCLGMCVMDQGKYTEADGKFQQAYDIRCKFFGVVDYRTAQSQHCQAIILRLTGRLKESLALHTEVLTTRKQVLPDNHVDITDSMQGQCECLILLGKYKEAEQLLTDTLEMRRMIFGDGSVNPKMTDILYLQGDLHRRLGNYPSAKKLLEYATDGRRQVFVKDHNLIAQAQLAMAELLADIGKFDKSARQVKKILKLRKTLYGEDHPDFAYTLSVYGDILRRQGKFQEAKKQFIEALASFRMIFGDSDTHVLVLECLHNQALLLLEASTVSLRADVSLLPTDEASPSKELLQLDTEAKDEEDGDEDETSTSAAALTAVIATAADTPTAEPSLEAAAAAQATIAPVSDTALADDASIGTAATAQSSGTAASQTSVVTATPSVAASVALMLDRDGVPIFNDGTFKEVLKCLESLLIKYQEHCAVDSDSNARLANIVGDIGVAKKLEYQARCKFFESLSKEHRRAVNIREKNDLLAQGLDIPDPDEEVLQEKITPGVDDITRALTVLAHMAINPEHTWIKKFHLHHVIVVMAMDEMDIAKRIYEDGERLRYQALFNAAEDKYDEALSTQVDHLGAAAAACNTDVANTIFGKAENARLQSNFATSKKYYLQCLTIWRKCEGDEGENTNKGKFGMAKLLQMQGLFEEAKVMLEQVIIGRCRLQYGKSHEYVVECQVALASVLCDLGLVQDALIMATQALQVLEKGGTATLPPTPLITIHPVLGTVNGPPPLTSAARSSMRITGATYLCLGKAYLAQASYSQATECLEKALQFRVKVFGEDHPDIAEVLHVKSILKFNLGKLAQARKLFAGVMKMRIKWLGCEKKAPVEGAVDVAAIIDGLDKPEKPVSDADVEEEDVDDAVSLMSPTSLASVASMGAERGVGKKLAMLSAKNASTKSITSGNDDDDADLMADIMAEIAIDGTKDKDGADAPAKFGVFAAKAPEVVEEEPPEFMQNDVVVTPHVLIADTLMWRGEVFLSLGEHLAARAMFEASLHMHKRVFGSNSSIFGSNASFGLARVQRITGSLQQSLETHQQVLSLRIQLLGENHLCRAESLAAIGGLTLVLGRIDEAQGMIDAAQSITLKVIPFEKHPVRAICLLDSADVLRAKGLFSDANELIIRALAIAKLCYGEAHPLVYTCLHMLGEISRDMGNLEQGYAMIEQAMSSRSMLLGDAHPHTLSCLFGLAETLRLQGRLAEAKKMLEQCIASRRDKLGKYHPDTTATLLALSFNYLDLSQYSVAKSMFQRSNQLLRRTYGADHPLVALGTAGLAQVAKCQAQFQLAKEFHEKALMTRRRLFGSNHPQIAESLYLLADLYMTLGSIDDATTMFDDALAMRRLTLGAMHGDVATSLEGLARILLVKGKLVESRNIHERVLVMRRAVLGPDHPDVADSLYYLALAQRVDGRLDQAGAQFERCLDILRTLKGPRHPIVARTLCSLADVENLMGNFSKAKDYYFDAMNIRLTIFGDISDHPDLTETYFGIAENLRLRGLIGAVATRQKAEDNTAVPATGKMSGSKKSKHKSGNAYISSGQGDNNLSCADSVVSALEDEIYNDEEDLSVSLENELNTFMNNQSQAAHMHSEMASPTSSVAAACNNNNKGAVEKDTKKKKKKENNVEENDNISVPSVMMSFVEKLEELSLLPKNEDNDMISLLDGFDEDLVMALPLYEKVLEQRKKYFNSEHPSVIQTQAALVETHHLLGNYVVAHDLAVHVLSMSRRIYGDDHPDTAAAMMNLAEVLKSMSRVFPTNSSSSSDDRPATENAHNKPTGGNNKKAPAKAFKQLKVVGGASLFEHLSSVLGTNNQLQTYWPPDVSVSLSAVTRGKVLPRRMHPLLSPKKEISSLTEGYKRGFMGYAFPNQTKLMRTNVAGVCRPPVFVFDDAKWLCDCGLLQQKKVFGDDYDHPTTASLLFVKGEIMRARRRIDLALPLFEQALDMRRRLFRGQHANVALCLYAIGECYRADNKHAKAIPLYDKALELLQLCYGPSHPTIADVKTSIAMVAFTEGRFTEAQPLYIDSLRMREKLLGATHPAVAQSLNNYAGLLHTMGDCNQAYQLYERALAIKSAVFGERHPDVASSMNNLGLVLKALGRFTEAEQHFKTAIEIQRNILGQEHPDVASTLSNMAALAIAMGNKIKAKEIYREAIDMRRKIFGYEHPTVASSLNNLAGLLYSLHEVDDAKDLYEESLRIRKKMYGENHVSVAESLNNIALVLFAQGLLAEALPLYERALAIKVASFGENHQTCASSMNNLAGLLHTMGKLSEAEELYSQALQIRRATLGDKHAETLSTLENLETLYADKRALLQTLPQATLNYTD